MAKAVGGVGRRVVRAVANDAAVSDQELLAQYLRGDQHAFAVLVERHGGMVFGVCRRAVATTQDAEDACQAVFVVLARKARSGRWQRSIANWLYATARRVAATARRAAKRRAGHEARTPPPAVTSALDQLTGREVLALLDDELDRLPPRYREPLVLCYLGGLSRDEAAARLGVPEATLKSQLDRGRRKLCDALTGRGVTLGVGLLAATVPPAGAAPPHLIESVLAAAGGTPPPAVLAIVKGVPMISGLPKLVLGVSAAFGLAAFGWVAGTPAHTSAADEKPAAKSMSAKSEGPKPAAKSETLTIQVVDADGKPVAGATVYRRGYTFVREVPEEVSVGKTGADGQLDTERKPFVTFHATADGYCTSASGYLTDVNPVTIRLAKPHPIKGRLVDLQGEPVPNAKVTVERVSAAENDDLTAAYNAYRVNPEWTGESLPIHLDGQATGAPKGTTTDADGRFELAGVGKLRVVRLRFEADGIERARAVVFADPEFHTRMKPRTDAEKKVGGMAGDYRATTHGPEFTHAARPDHVITGTITDALTGKPVKGMKVAGTASPVGSAFVGSPWHDQVEATTDADGKFRLAGLVKAKVRTLHVMGSDTAAYLDHVVEVADTDGYTPAVAGVKVQPAVLVLGQLRNKATGEPVAGGAQWLPLTTNEPLLKGADADARLYTSQLGNTWPSGSRAVVAADGRFTLRVPPGPGVILARCDQFDPAAVFTPARVRDEDRKYLRKNEKGADTIEVGPRDRDGEQFFDTIFFITPIRWENGYAIVNPDAKAKAVEATIEFDPGTTVTLAATDPDGKPLGGVTVVGPGGYGRNPPTFAKPEIAVGGIDPKGRPVQLYLLHQGRKLCAAVTLKGDEKGPVAVKMRPCGSVSAKVVDHTGKPVKGARVMFQMADSVADDLVRQKLSRGAAEVTTDADGRFTFPRMFPDLEFDLFVGLPGFRSGAAASKRVALKPGEAKDAGEFRTRDPKKIDDE